MLFGTILIVLLVSFSDAAEVIDKGTHILICQKDALELGIVFDSSSSIPMRDFNTGIAFLQDFLGQFDIGQGPKQVRVSIITYGKGIFPADGFNLNTYNTKQEVIDALAEIPHRHTTYTDTGKAIAYMHNSQLNYAQSRPGVPRVGIVFTDGNSQDWRYTGEAATAARNDGITMFAVGVGLNVQDAELLRIAGEQSRVARVDSYDQLESIKELLAHKTCIRQEKATLPPPPQLQECGSDHPSDVYFLFSPATLGLDVTGWATQLVTRVIEEEPIDGFRYGLITGDCPADAGFDLDEYDNVDDIKRRLAAYDRSNYEHLLNQALHRYGASYGARPNAQRVAVLVAEGKFGEINAQVRALVDANIRVFIADPRSSGLSIPGAITLVGQTSLEQASNLLQYLCS